MLKIFFTLFFLIPVFSINSLACSMVDLTDYSQYTVVNGQVFFKKHEYASSDVLKDVDPTTFVVLNKRYAKDKKQVYFEGRVVPLADSEKFRAFWPWQDIDNLDFYAEDGRFIYFGDDIISHVANHFERIELNYYQDAYSLFYSGKIVAQRTHEPIKTADNFLIYGAGVYIYGRKTAFDGYSFKVVGYAQRHVRGGMCFISPLIIVSDAKGTYVEGQKISTTQLTQHEQKNGLILQDEHGSQYKLQYDENNNKGWQLWPIN